MAELILRIGGTKPDPALQDGDIIAAKNQADIKFKHAQKICDPTHFGFETNGLRQNSGLMQQYMELIYQYRFVRTGEYSANKVNIATSQVEEISNWPNLVNHINKKVSFARHRVFGSTGSEVWYGGSIDFSPTNMTKLWNMIEGETAYREVDHQLWPWKDKELTYNLMLKVNDFTHAEASIMCEKVSENVIQDSSGKWHKKTVKARKRKVPYAFVVNSNLLDNIRNKTVKVDIRSAYQFTHSNIIQEKT